MNERNTKDPVSVSEEEVREKSRPKRSKVEVSCHVDAMQAPVRRGIFCSCFFVCEWCTKIDGYELLILLLLLLLL
jgi:hypothetical protein